MTNTLSNSNPFTEWTVIKLIRLGSSLYSSTSLIKLISSKKSSNDIRPSFSSKALVIDLNSSKFSSLTSDSRLCSLSSSFFIPEASSTLSINSVKVKSSATIFSFSIVFLNSNSLPELIASYILIPSSSALEVKFSIVFKPIPLFGVLITLKRLILSLELWIRRR